MKSATPAKRRWRWAVLGVLALFIATPFVLLRIPETEWFQRRVSDLAREKNIGLSWRSLSCSWMSGQCELSALSFENDGLRVGVDSLRLAWHWWPLFSSQVEVKSLVAKGVHVERFAAAAPDDEPSTPLSRSHEVLKTPLPIEVEKFIVEGVDVRWPIGKRRLEVTHLDVAGSAQIGVNEPTVVVALDGLGVRVIEGDVVRLDTELAMKVAASVVGDELTLTAKSDVTKSQPAWPLSNDDVLALGVKAVFADARVDVELNELSALSGAVVGHANASIPDEGAPRIDDAKLTAELDSLLPLLRLFEPTIGLEDATLHAETQGDELKAKFHARQLGALGSEVKDVELTAAGKASELTARLTANTVSAGPARATNLVVDATKTLDDINATATVKSLVVDGDAQTSVAPSSLTLKATLGDQTTLQVSGAPGVVKVTAGGLVIDVHPAPLIIDAALDAELRLIHAEAKLPLRDISAANDTGRIRIDSMTHTLSVDGDPRDEAKVEVALGLANITGRRDDSSLTVSNVDLSGVAKLKQWKPEHIEGAVTHSGLHTLTEPGRITYSLDTRPGELDALIEGTLPPLTVHATAKKRGQSVHGTALASATSLGVLAPLIPGDIALDPSTLGFKFDGTVDMPDTSRPTELSLDANFTMPKLVVHRDARRISVDALGFHLTHRHADKVDRGKAKLRLERPSVEEATIDGAVESHLAVELDRSRGLGSLKLTLDAKKERTLALELGLRREKDGRLHHDLDVDVSHLGVWAPLVGELSATPPGLMLEKLTAHLVSHGDTLGLLDADFMPAHEWKASSDTTFHADLDVRNIVHHVDGEETKAPHVNMRIDAGVLHGALKMAAKLEVPTVEVDIGTQHLALTGVHQKLSMHSETDPDAGLLHIDLDGTIDELEQNLWPPWQPSAVHLNIDGNVDRLAELNIEKFLLESPNAGTKLEFSNKFRAEGASDDGQRLRLQGKLTQDLSKLDGAPRTFMGQGVVAVGLRMQSADLSTFRVRGKVELADAGVQLPAQHLVAEGATGVIPFEEAFTVDATRGVQLVVAADPSAFARARAAELQPFLSQDGSLTLRRVQWKDIELAPVVASIAIEPNRFALYKLKAERGRARISGQLFVDFRPGEEVVNFRGTLTGLERKGAATPLDANAAFTFVPRRLEIDGRVQVVRTSKEHLLDLLDVIDPHREVGSLNTVRNAMAFGYPREAQIDFADGLLSMDIAFGGLAGLFELGTVRGVSLGPFFNRYVAPALRSSP